MGEEMLRKLCPQARDWGTWRPDDELGTLNYITPGGITAAVRLATRGAGTPINPSAMKYAVC